MPIISNTTVISNFASVGQLKLLQKLFGTVYISDQVFDEIQMGLFEGYTFYADLEKQIFPFSNTGWLYLTALNTTEEFQVFGKLLTELHSGEASSLSIAYHRKWILLSDDKAARKASKNLKVSISGTIGILLSLAQKNALVLNEADIILKQMIKQGYYSPVISLEEIITS